ncbi:MAG: pyridoxal phosphate-dependent aminotransferase [candidate division Zixibacteria bacterium]|nr:pyridoxal phosphate-dependent aminotransferase [candidate division Zixibacteria bacterium]
MKLAARMSRLGTETAFEVLARARKLEAAGREIIHLEIGEPDFDTPQNIRDAACRALNDGYTHYNPSAGIPELREAVAAEVSRTRNIKVKPEQVVITPGAKPIMFFVMLAMLEPEHEVIYPNPGFPIYESLINYLGSKPVPIRLREENQFRLDVGELKKLVNSKTRLLILNSPQNPTGGVLTHDDLSQIAEIVREFPNLNVLSDEMYSRILYSGRHESIAGFPEMLERTIILDGFSKTFAMTGWRLGFGVMDENLAVAVARLQTNSNSCTATFTQVAGIEALTGDQTEIHKMVAEFKKRRDVLINGLNQIHKIKALLPQGAFYAFPNISATGWESKKLADYLLEKAGVAVLSGTSFGKFGEGYLRLSYANSVANIHKALEKIKKALSEL